MVRMAAVVRWYQAPILCKRAFQRQYIPIYQELEEFASGTITKFASGTIME
jgi:hypothetical protein